MGPLGRGRACVGTVRGCGGLGWASVERVALGARLTQTQLGGEKATCIILPI